MTASCPRCHQPLAIPSALTTVRCASCGARFKVTRAMQERAAGSVPPPPASTAAAAPTSPAAAEVPPVAEVRLDAPAPARRFPPAVWAGGGAVVGAGLLFAALSLLGWGPSRRPSPPISATSPAPAASAPASRPAALPPLVASAGSVRAFPDWVEASADVGVSAAASARPPVADLAPPASRPAAVASSQPATQPATRPAVAHGGDRPALQPTPIPAADRVTDAAIEDSIRRGVEVMLREFDAKDARLSGIGGKPDALACGLNALCVYSLMQAGLAIDDPRISPRSDFMKNLVDAMKRVPADHGYTQTYARGLRATALATYNRPNDRGKLMEDVGCLYNGHVLGAYGYGTARLVGSNQYKFDPPGWLDNSNSQYGLLGVWSGAEAGLEIPANYWEQVADHWATHQDANGTWGYNVTTGAVGAGGTPQGQRPPQRHTGLTRSPLAMTAAGLASSLVARDYLIAARRDAAVGLDPYPAPIGKALDWWELGDNSVRIPDLHWGYVLYGVERVGLASGLKYFGKHDWYRTLTADVFKNQRPGGGWTRPDAENLKDSTGDEQVMGDRPNTAFALLFLSRGRHPVMINKLRFDGGDGKPGYWANRPRDAAGLTRFVGRQLERPLNWQVVDLKHDWQDWTDAPILYIASHEPPKFTDADFLKFRAFVLAGGLIFTQADGDSPSFTQWVQGEFVQKVLPRYEYRDVPREHPLYHSLFPMTAFPPLRAVSNGSRVLMLHSPKDVALSWQFRDEKFRRDYFELGSNLILYAAGRRDFRNRVDGTFVPAPPDPPATGRTIRLARLEYDGDWNPEPYAWIRYPRLFQYRTGSALEAKQTKWAELKPGDAPIAHLTGTARYQATDAEVAALKAYVEAGGVLLVDHAGGLARFPESARDALARAFPDKKPAPLPPADPVLNAGAEGMTDLTQPKLRPYAADLLGRQPVTLESFDAGKGRVIFTRLDVTNGLLGTNTLPILGFAPKYAEALMQNLIFYAVDRAAAVSPASH